MAVFSKRVATRRKLLELAEAAFDQVALGIEVGIERMFGRGRRVVGDDGDGVFIGDHGAEGVGVIGRVGDHHLGRQTLDEGRGLRRVACLTGVRMKRTGQPRPRTARWILVVRPPRERPIA